MLSNKSLDGGYEAFTTFFNKTDIIKYVPRCMLLDIESTVIDEIKTSTCCQLFHLEQTH